MYTFFVIYSKSDPSIMFVAANVLFCIPKKKSILSRTATINIQKRFMMAAKTKIYSTEKEICTKIMRIYNEYNRLENKTADAFLTMGNKLLYLHPKLGQHFLAALHPKKKFDIESLREKYNIPIVDNAQNGIADLNDTISTVHAHRLMKIPFFKDTQINVLTNGSAQGKNEIKMSQTGQKNPDYLTQFFDQNTFRYQDYKVTNTTVNKGHVTLLHQEEYDARCQKLFMGYRTEFANIRDIDEKIKIIHNEKNLTCNQRVEIIQEFLKKKLSVQPTINPSYIFKTQPDEELDCMNIDYKYKKIFENSEVFKDTKSTYATLARGMIIGGPDVMNGYLNDKDANPLLQQTLVSELKTLAENAEKIFHDI